MRLFLAILLMSSTQLATQMVLPALPDIARHFALSEADAQQIIMLYFISFGFSQLFYGPWVDSVGRRQVFFTGLGLFLVGTILCVLAVSSEMLAIGRVLQGLGAGSPLILSRTILSSTMQGERLKKAFGSLAIAASMTSLAAPFLGGIFTSMFGWQQVFAIFIVHLVLALLAGSKLLPPDQQTVRQISVRRAIRDYAELITDVRFFTAGLFKWLPTMTFMSLATFLPFEMQRRFGLSVEQYGSMMTLTLFGLLIGSTIARVLQRYFSSETIIAIFWPLYPIAGWVLLVHPPSVISTMIAVTLFMVLSGSYYANALQLVMHPFKEKGGTASALVGSIDMLVFSLLAAVVNRYWVTDLASLGELFITCSIVVVASWLGLKAKTSRFVAKTDDLCLADNNIKQKKGF